MGDKIFKLSPRRRFLRFPEFTEFNESSTPFSRNSIKCICIIFTVPADGLCPQDVSDASDVSEIGSKSIIKHILRVLFCSRSFIITRFCGGQGNLTYIQQHYCSKEWNPIEMFCCRDHIWSHLELFNIR